MGGESQNSGKTIFYRVSLNSLARDNIIKEIAANNKALNIVYLGAGFNTAAERIGNPLINFYEVDIESNIEARQKLLPDTDNDHSVICHPMSLDYLATINLKLPTIIVATEILHFYPQEQVIRLIKTLKAKIPQGAIIFTAIHSLLKKKLNNYLASSGNNIAKILTNINNVKAFALQTNSVNFDTYPIYQDTFSKVNTELKLGAKFKMKLVDFLKLYKIVVLHFGRKTTTPNANPKIGPNSSSKPSNPSVTNKQIKGKKPNQPKEAPKMKSTPNPNPSPKLSHPQGKPNQPQGKPQQKVIVPPPPKEQQ